MIKQWMGTVLLALSLVGGGALMAGAAQAAVADDVQQIVAAHAGDTDNGAALQAALASLISGSANPATTAAEAMAALGDSPSPALLKALGGAIEGTSGITSEDLAQAIGKVVANGGIGADGISANVIGVAQYMGADNRHAAGRGLAIAVARLQGEPGTVDVAGRIVAQVDASDLDEVKTAYADAAAEIETGSLSVGGDSLLQANANPAGQQSPN